MAFCIPLLGAALPRAYAQTLDINNMANVSFGVHFRIHNGDCTSSYLVLDTCVTVPANTNYNHPLLSNEFLLGTKIQCEDCGEESPYVGSSFYPESRESFRCGGDPILRRTGWQRCHHC